MSRKNAYAAKMMAAKARMKAEQRAEITEQSVTRMYLASGIALNRAFGFGGARIERFRDELNGVIDEFNQLQTEVDTDYADGRLEDEFARVMQSGAGAKRKPPE